MGSYLLLYQEFLYLLDWYYSVTVILIVAVLLESSFEAMVTVVEPTPDPLTRPVVVTIETFLLAEL